MKKQNKFFMAGCSAVLALFAASCSLPAYNSETPVYPGMSNSSFTDYSSYSIQSAEVEDDFIRGVDASEVKALEECGIKFYDDNNSEKDVFEIFAEHDVNWIRLRIWNDYTQALSDDWAPYGYNNLSRTINMAQRAKKYGMKVLLDFHYSDNWADPSKQKCPAMWSSISNYTELATAVGTYTEEIIQAMIDADCAPDMVQLGNEMQGGLFQTGSSVSNAKSYTSYYLKAGAEVVRELLPDCEIMLHMSNGGNSSYLNTMLSYASAVGNDGDGNPYVTAIGVSYYPYYTSHYSDTALKTNLNKIKNNGYRVIIAENSFGYSNSAYTDSTSNEFWEDDEETCASMLTGYDKYEGIVDGKIPASIENQAGVMEYLMELCSEVDSQGGYFYWGSAYLGVENKMNSSWENQALFDVNGKVLPSMDVFINK